MEEGTSRKKVLVAEDTESNYALVHILLRRDYDVVRAVNGVEAVRMNEELHPDLILMDIQMPEMNGLEATREIRRKDPKLPIIGLSAFAFDVDREEFMNAGGSDYITKPLSSAGLLSMIGRLIRESEGCQGQS